MSDKPYEITTNKSNGIYELDIKTADEYAIFLLESNGNELIKEIKLAIKKDENQLPVAGRSYMISGKEVVVGNVMVDHVGTVWVTDECTGEKYKWGKV